MAVPIERKQYSLDEYERMIETGILQEDDRVELIEGGLVDMAPLGLRHEACVRRLDLLFHERLLRKAIVSIQNSVRILPNSQPEPDVALLKWRDDLYEDARPTPQDVLLIVEVADSSLLYDRNRKRPLYAKAAIPDYWIVNLQEDVIEVFSNPHDGVYQDAHTVRRGDRINLPGDFEGTIGAEEILGQKR
jgi:Uma2 family endonuclease